MKYVELWCNNAASKFDADGGAETGFPLIVA